MTAAHLPAYEGGLNVDKTLSFDIKKCGYHTNCSDKAT